MQYIPMKMERFGEALQSVRAFPHLDKQAFIDLQSIMLDERVAVSDYRTDQNYVGETVGRREIFHFISPKPEDVASLMQGLIDFLANSDGIDPVVVAAVASFGFVFILNSSVIPFQQAGKEEEVLKTEIFLI
jgi:Fic family protein